MTKKILILYTSIGLGHKFIAFNMAYHLEKAGYEVKLADALQLQKGLMADIGEWLHSLINRRFPFIWRWLYLSKIFTNLTLPLRLPAAAKNHRLVKHEIDVFQPDLVISTQTTPSAIVSYLKKNNLYSGKFFIGFSDYHLHRYWLYDQADLYLANIPEQVQDMKELGVKQPVIISGITLQPRVSVNSEEIKKKLEIDIEKKVILVSSGSLGIGFPQELLEEFIVELVKKESNTHVIIVCGKNEILQKVLQNKNFPNTTILGFYQPMAEIYAITDLFLTKPGGLTTAECLQAEVPMQITHWLPGQEELNYQYLTSHALVYPVPEKLSAEKLIETVQIRLTSARLSENEALRTITQKNHEGEVLLNTVEKLFHGVFDEQKPIS